MQHCELCQLDAAFYGQPLRVFEGVRICLGCYLDMNGSGYDADNWRDLSNQFIRHLPTPERAAA